MKKEFSKENVLRIIKYIFTSGSSFLIDLFLFNFFNTLLSNLGALSIIVATILARIISSLYNYFVNARLVFKKYNKNSIIKYYVLVIIQMFISAISVYLISLILSSVNETLIKLGVDIVIFIINYFILREVVFK